MPLLELGSGLKKVSERDVSLGAGLLVVSFARRVLVPTS